MNRFFIHLAYDGTPFHGWQRQPNGVSVQQRLEDALSMMLRTPVVLTGAGRTDSGVHAADFYAHFDFEAELGDREREKLVFSLNSFLPEEISVFSIFQVPLGAHARFSAISRTYRYILTGVKNPFRNRFAQFLYGPLDIEAMNRGAEIIKGYTDFTSFSKVDTDTATNLCCISEACWNEEGNERVFTITADRFLRNMVRAIVGTLLDVGRGKITPEDLRGIIESRDRCKASDSAPAKGLILYRIVYPEGVVR
ncbi:MAG TPA: tRNA pseudouridine(38-40) synthase TruA [Bacteroidales bacterium]|nr:tRNA pseudouridine(38-40) synthase TruA [Bacteroidales bacterium]